MRTEIKENEYWWGLAVSSGHDMPYSRKTEAVVHVYGEGEGDQFAPLLLSSKGRYIWSEKPITAKIGNGVIECDAKLYDGYENLKGAYLAAMKTHFPFNGEMPDELFFAMPQYNTWIEMGTEQTTDNILNYANGLLSHGFPAGVMMIDGGWQEDYGYFDFNRRKVPEPKVLMDELHRLGFKVMLWVSPIVSSAGVRFKELRAKGYLLKDREDNVAVRKWWSGYSAVLDFTNPEAVKWFREKLDALRERYGVDGFKFDAGDRSFYSDDDKIYKPMSARDQTTAFNEAGVIYKFNEFRAAYKFGGRPIVARLHDKYHSWDKFGLNTLIPHTIMQGLCGYAYCCPDMVGGGILDCFGSGKDFDEELFVRWAQANALMAMMQISVAPYRVLSEKNFRLVLDAVKLRMEFSPLVMELARHAAKTGEPIVRHMAYEFPDESFEQVNDQFMLGSDLLVTPVLEKGCSSRKVRFPKGRWQAQDGTVYDGGEYEIAAAIEDGVPYFKRTI